jgi:Plavaka transposase
LGSDKTTVSVATGQNEYWPVYLSIGNLHNNVRRAHRNGLVLLGFLAIPKSMSFSKSDYCTLNQIIVADHEYQNDANFRKFRRQLLHSSLAKILESLKPFMTQAETVRCADGYFRRVIYGLGPYIADYPEQALLACIVQGWCPR